MASLLWMCSIPVGAPEMRSNFYSPDPARQRLRLSRSPDFDKQQTDGLKVNL